MKNSKQFDVAEGVFKRYGLRRTRKSDWRKKWLVMADGATQEFKQLTRGLKMRTQSYVPRVFVKNPQRPRSAESEFGLKFVPPSLRKELADFVGWNTAAGRNADEAEAAFFRRERLALEPGPKVVDRSYPRSTRLKTAPIDQDIS